MSLKQQDSIELYLSNLIWLISKMSPIKENQTLDCELFEWLLEKTEFLIFLNKRFYGSRISFNWISQSLLLAYCLQSMHSFHYKNIFQVELMYVLRERYAGPIMMSMHFYWFRPRRGHREGGPTAYSKNFKVPFFKRYWKILSRDVA